MHIKIVRIVQIVTLLIILALWVSLRGFTAEGEREVVIRKIIPLESGIQETAKAVTPSEDKPLHEGPSPDQEEATDFAVRDGGSVEETKPEVDSEALSESPKEDGDLAKEMKHHYRRKEFLSELEHDAYLFREEIRKISDASARKVKEEAFQESRKRKIEMYLAQEAIQSAQDTEAPHEEESEE